MVETSAAREVMSCFNSSRVVSPISGDARAERRWVGWCCGGAEEAATAGARGCGGGADGRWNPAAAVRGWGRWPVVAAGSSGRVIGLEVGDAAGTLQRRGPEGRRRRRGSCDCRRAETGEGGWATRRRRFALITKMLWLALLT
jgi:hypothetical protein